MTLQALRAAGKLREGGGKVGSRQQTPCPCRGLVTPEPFLTTSHLPFSYPGLFQYFQCDPKLHSMKTITVFAFALHILAAKQTSGYISLQHHSISNQLCCLWFRAIQVKKVWNPVCKSSNIFTEGDFTKQKYCPVPQRQLRYHLLIQMICTVKNAKKKKCKKKIFHGSIKTIDKTMSLCHFWAICTRCLVATSDFV